MVCIRIHTHAFSKLEISCTIATYDTIQCLRTYTYVYIFLFKIFPYISWILDNSVVGGVRNFTKLTRAFATMITSDVRKTLTTLLHLLHIYK